MQLACSQVFGFLVTDTFVALGCLIVALYYCWELTLVLLATIPVSVFAMGLISRGLETAMAAQKNELGQATKFVTAAVTAIDIVKVYNGFDNEVWQYMESIKRASGFFVKQARRHAMTMGWIKLWMVNMFVIGFWFAVWLVVNNRSTAGNAITTFYSMMNAFQTIEGFGPQSLVLIKGIAAGHSLKSILLDVAKTGKEVRGMKGSHKPATCSGDIELHNVSFAYPSNPDKLVLNPASFFFASGELTFLVGRSGSGKSTLSNLILKFYPPATGSISIDGHSLETLDDTWVRGNVTLIQQSSILFNDSFFMNVAFGGRDSNCVSREEVQAACEMAMLQSTLAGLPEGLNTNVGQGGYNLSGGQRQRLALARARLRDPPILILDEVTSGLDPVSRVLILEAIRIWRKGKTTIIITHDVNQIQDEDYVYVMDKAHLVQEGYRKKLVENDKGMFATLIALTEAEGNEGDQPVDALGMDDKYPSADFSDPESEASTSTDITPVAALPRSRLSVMLPQQPTSIYARNSGLFSMSFGGGFRGSKMYGEDAWGTPSALTDAQRPKYQSRASSRNMAKRDDQAAQRPRKSSLDLVTERGLSVRNLRPRVMRSEVCRDDQELSEFDRRGSTARILGGFPPEDKLKGKKKRKQGELQLSLFRILSTVWPVLSKTDRIRMSIGLFACMIAAAANPAFSYVFAQLIAVFWSPESEMSSSGRNWAIRLTIIAAADGTSLFIAHYCMQCVGQSWVKALRIEAFKRILSQPKEFFDKQRHSPSRIVEVLDRSAEEMQNLVGRFTPIMLIILGMVLGSFGWSLALSWKLTLVAMSAGPVIYGATFFNATVSAKWEARTNSVAAAASSVSTETFLNIRVVRALTLEDYFARKHNQATEDSYKIGVKRGFWIGLFYGLNQCQPWWMTALILYYALAILTAPGVTPSVTDVMQVINLLLFSVSTATAMLNGIPQLAQAKAAAIQLLFYANLSYTTSHEGRGDKRVTTPFPVEMRKLQFAYPATKSESEADAATSSRRKVLRNVNLRISQGEYVAIVGASGCGKSTIANLLLRLYEPGPLPAGMTDEDHQFDEYGEGLHYRENNGFSKAPLTYAHVPASQISTQILRTHMASVPQHPFLFPTTIRENILYGLHPDSPHRSQAAIEAAAKLACIHDFVTSLTDGYNTVVGEGGVGLSGGQMQRLSIARALVRRPKLLVLDEPTSALDADGAEGVRVAIKDLVEDAKRRGGSNGSDMTVVTVTHSKEMMRMAERLVVMDAGFVAEEGEYEKLLGHRGKFAELVGGGAWMPNGPDANAPGKSKCHKRSGSHQHNDKKEQQDDDQWWKDSSDRFTDASFTMGSFVEGTAQQNAVRRPRGPPRQVVIKKDWYE